MSVRASDNKLPSSRAFDITTFLNFCHSCRARFLSISCHAHRRSVLHQLPNLHIPILPSSSPPLVSSPMPPHPAPLTLPQVPAATTTACHALRAGRRRAQEGGASRAPHAARWPCPPASKLSVRPAAMLPTHGVVPMRNIQIVPPHAAHSPTAPHTPEHPLVSNNQVCVGACSALSRPPIRSAWRRGGPRCRQRPLGARPSGGKRLTRR